jgi:hypothetical protein
MPKKRATPRKGGTSVEPDNGRAVVISVKGTPEFRDWLTELADFDRATSVQTLEKALVYYARHIGFKKDAPRRTVR